MAAAAVRQDAVAVALALLGAEAAAQMRAVAEGLRAAAVAKLSRHVAAGALRAVAVVELSRRAAAGALRAEAALVELSRRAAAEALHAEAAVLKLSRPAAAAVAWLYAEAWAARPAASADGLPWLAGALSDRRWAARRCRGEPWCPA